MKENLILHLMVLISGLASIGSKSYTGGWNYAADFIFEGTAA